MAMHENRSSRRRLGVAALCAGLLLPPATRAAAPGMEREPPEETAGDLRENDSASPRADRDRPRERFELMRQLRGPASAELLARELLEIRKERFKVGQVDPMADDRLPQSAARVPGTAWVNLGPAGESKLQAQGDGTLAPALVTNSGRARSIIPDPNNPDVLYFATAAGGVWKTTDATSATPHWESISDSLGTLSVGALAMDPASSQILFLGFGDPFDNPMPGIVTSRDGGATWSNPLFLTATYGGNSRTAISTSDVKVDPTNSAHVLVATNVGLFQSSDAGGSYSQVQLPDSTGKPAAYYVWSLGWTGGSNWLATGVVLNVGDPAKPGPDDGKLGLFRSTDSGQTWTNITVHALPAGAGQNTGRTTLAIAPSTTDNANTSRIYLLAASIPGDLQRDVFRSDDGGQTFISLHVNSSGRPINPTPNGNTLFAPQVDLNIMNDQAWYNQAIVVHPWNPDVVFIGGNITSARSLDGGNSWSLLTYGYPFAYQALPYAHPDNHAMAIGVAGGTAVYYGGNDGGLTRSTDAITAAPGKAHFDDSVNRGIVAHLVYDLACAPESWPAALQGFTVGGLQDNGTRLRSGNTTAFDEIQGGDGIGVAVSRTTNAAGTAPALLVASFPGALQASDDGGNRFTAFQDGIPRGAALGYAGFYTRVVADTAAADPLTFLVFTTAPDSSVYKSSAGQAFTSINGIVHYFDGSTTSDFSLAGSPLSLRQISAFPGKSGVYAVNSGAHGFVTADNGANWCGSITLGQPATPIGLSGASSIAVDPSDTTFKTYFMASKARVLFDGVTPVPDNIGHLFKTTDCGVTFTPVGAGGGAGSLPNIPIDVVKFDPNDKDTIYVGTGAGLYRSIDHGASFQRYGTGLPLVEVTDLCIAPASGNLKVSTYGRGFWQINTGLGGNPAGVKGHGDLDFNQRLDAFDLIDLASALGTTQADVSYSAEADLVGSVNAVDDADLTAFLSRFGSKP